MLPIWKLVKPLFVLLFVPVFTQVYTQNIGMLPELSVRAEKIGLEEGIPEKNIKVVYQDKTGFIWLGTSNELVKYDGYQFLSYRYPSKDSILIHFEVSSITEDLSGDLWIGCQYINENQPVLFRFNRATEILIPVFYDSVQEQSLIQSDVMNLHFDGRYLWIDARWLYRIDLASQIHKADTAQNPAIKIFKEIDTGFHNFNVFSIFKDSRQRLWFPGAGGIYQWVPSADSLIYYPSPREGNQEMSQPVVITFLHESPDGWFYAFSGERGPLFRFEPQLGTYKPIGDFQFDLSNYVRSCALDTFKKRLWLGTPNGAGNLMSLDLEEGKIWNVRLQLDDGLSTTKVKANSILYDNDDNIWIASEGSSLIKCSPQANQFKWIKFDPAAMNSISSDAVFDFQQNDKGQIWIATYGGGLNQWDIINNTFSSIQSLKGNRNISELTGIETDTAGNIWMGAGFSIFQYDPQTKQYQAYDGGGTTFSILQTSIGDIYAAKTRGLFQFSTDSNNFVKVKITHPDNPNSGGRLWIEQIFEDSKRRLWLGTHPNNKYGCILYDPQVDSTIYFELPKMNGFAEDENGKVWLGTIDGLFHLDPIGGSWKRYGQKEGLSNDVINSVLKDAEGHLWIATDNGLNLFDPDTQNFKRYFTSDGLPFNSFNNSSLKYRDGRLLFGSNNGILIFDPKQIKFDKKGPQLVFTALEIFDEPLKPQQGGLLEKHISLVPGIVLPYWKNDLTIHFAALHFKNPDKNQYRTFLEGYDVNWKRNGTDRSSHYTNLDPGHYVFRVRGANSDGIWSEDEIALNIVIRPPWWQTIWAYLGYVLVVGLLSYGLYQFLLNRRLEKEEARRLRELDEVKTKLYTNITHEFRTPLTIILGMTDKIKKDPTRWFNEGLGMIRRNGQQLLQLINQILDLRKLEAGKLTMDMVQTDILPFLQYQLNAFQSLAAERDIRLHFITEEKEIHMDFAPKELGYILNNLLSNAIKNNKEGGDVYVSVNKYEGRRTKGERLGNKEFDLRPSPFDLQIKVRDTGIGIPSDQLPHIFDRFYQVNTEAHRYLSKAGQGSGIGLAMCKELAGLMKAGLSVQSQVDEGTSFYLSLPVTNEKQLISSKSIIKKEGQGDSSVLLPLEQGLDQAGDLPQLLIVEDNKDVVRYLSSCLEDHYQLEISYNGAEGIATALELVPDLIISDVMMPEKDGYELCETLKEDVSTSHIPIILLTAKGDLDSKIKGLKYGADAYLAKPFKEEELLVRAEQLIQQRQKLRDKYSSSFDLDRPVSESIDPEEQFLQKIRDFVLAHLQDETYSIQRLCRDLQVSRTQLHMKLKALTGKPTSHVIRDIKLRKARQLLRETDLNISEIAYQSGFSRLSYFTKVFTETFHQTPSEYRKE